MGTTFRSEVIKECERTLEEKINTVTAGLQALNDAMEGESKSSAGDKHETGRARLQAEQVLLQSQLSQLLNDRDSFAKVCNNDSGPVITPGSLVETDHGIFFIAVALGKINVSGRDVQVISAASPLGRLFVGSRVGGVVEVNAARYRIMAVNGFKEGRDLHS
jgi:transcription elongation GreA/GreB family factor